ncbi:MAG TPA: bifunctional nuclease family protein [Gemmatimonadales bacterium]
MIKMSVAHLGVDRSTNSPVVILREIGGERSLPIWIGTSEANAIAMEMQGVKPQRPMTHDLLKHLLAGLGGELRRVHITDLRDDTYFAELQIVRGEQVVQVDARPSDSIALALRCNAPIFTSETLLDRASASSSSTEPTTDPEALKRYLEKLDPQDFGRFQP